MSNNDQHPSRGSRIPVLKARPAGSKGVSYYEMERRRRGLGSRPEPPKPQRKFEKMRPPDGGEALGDDHDPIGGDQGQSEQSEIRHSDITASPVIPAYNNFIDGQGDQNEEDAFDSKPAVTVVTSKGDSAYSSKPLVETEPLQRELTLHEIKDEKVTILYKNPQSRLSLELSHDTSEESFGTETSSLEIVASSQEKIEADEVTLCHFMPEQFLHELVEDERDSIMSEDSFSMICEEHCTETKARKENCPETKAHEEYYQEPTICEQYCPETKIHEEYSPEMQIREEYCQEAKSSEENCPQVMLAEEDWSEIKLFGEDSPEMKMKSLDQSEIGIIQDRECQDSRDKANDEHERIQDEEAENDILHHQKEEKISHSVEIENGDGCLISFSGRPQDNEELENAESIIRLSGLSSLAEIESIPCFTEQNWYEIDDQSENEMDATVTEVETYLLNDDSCSVNDLLLKVSSSNLESSVKAIISEIISNTTDETFTNSQYSESERSEQANNEESSGWIEDFKKKTTWDHERLLNEFDELKIKDPVPDEEDEDRSQTVTKKVSEGYLEAFKKFSQRNDESYMSMPNSDSEEECTGEDCDDQEEDMQIFFSKTFHAPTESNELLENTPKSNMNVISSWDLTPKSSAEVQENFRKLITRMHEIEDVVPETVTLSRIIQSKKRTAQKKFYSGNFTVKNPTDHVVGFEFSSNDDYSQFVTSCSRSILKPNDSIDIAIWSRTPYLSDDHLQSVKLYLRVLSLGREPIADSDLATLFKRQRQQDKRYGKVFTILPIVENAPEDFFDMEEAATILKRTSFFSKLRAEFTGLASDMKGLSSSLQFVATSGVVLYAVYMFFGLNMNVVFSSLNTTFLHPLTSGFH